MSRSADLVVVGGTPSGIAAAVRASSLGLAVVLIEPRRLGGLVAGGLCTMDVQYEGLRAPLYDGLYQSILDYYREKYGESSSQYANTVPRAEWPMTFEPHVGAFAIDALVASAGFEVVRGRVAHVERAGRRILAVAVETDGEPGQRRVEGVTFVDATYEGDLFAMSGEPYKVGREDRNEFGEPHAGRIFSRRVNAPDGIGTWPRAGVTGEMNLRSFKSITMEVFAGSTGEGDHRVQAYNYRLCLSRVPENRRMPERPEGYDSEVYRAVDDGRGIGEANMPNEKRFWWRNLIGPNWDYPDADESGRAEIREQYRKHALGYLYFLQHDESVAPDVQAEALEWGLALDEYPDNDNIPYELYVREARRLRGRFVFTEHDASLARGYDRTPVHADSVAFTEWFMDSHQVGPDHQVGSSGDGEILLTELTRPAQVPYRAMLPVGLDNLLVTVCVSATHVGWGALRLEPVWMHLGEVAGYAAALVREGLGEVATLPVGRLQRDLVEHGVAITFFNDSDIGSEDPAVPALQFFGTRGFFNSYDARPGEVLTESVARAWVRAIVAEVEGSLDPDAVARSVAVAEADGSAHVDRADLRTILDGVGILTGRSVAPAGLDDVEHSPLTRGSACRLLLAALDATRAPAATGSVRPSELARP